MRENKISARQSGMLCVMLIFANKLLLLPSLLFEEIGADGFWVIVVLLFVDLLGLGGFFMLKARYPSEKFYDILKDNLGKILAKTIVFLFLIFFLFKTFLTFSVVYMFLKQTVYQEDFEFLALIALLPVLNHGIISGIRTISRSIELFFYFVCAGLILCVAISITNQGGMPLFFHAPVPAFFDSVFKHMFSFGDFLILYLIIDKIQIKPNQGRKILNIVLFGVVLLLTILLRFYSIYRVTGFMHNNALLDISSVAAEYSAIGKLDIFPMLTIMFLTYFQLEVFIFGFCQSFIDLCPKYNKIHAIILFDIVFLVLYHGVLSQYDFFLLTAENYFSYFIIIVNVLVPLICAFISIKVRKRRKYEKIF